MMNHKTYFKKPVFQSKKYLDHVRQQPCITCGYRPVEAHHVRLACNSGTGIKPGDVWALPLCKLHHLEYHQIGKDTFFERHGIDVYRELFLIVKDWIEKK